MIMHSLAKLALSALVASPAILAALPCSAGATAPLDAPFCMQASPFDNDLWSCKGTLRSFRESGDPSAYAAFWSGSGQVGFESNLNGVQRNCSMPIASATPEWQTILSAPPTTAFTVYFKTKSNLCTGLFIVGSSKSL
jgi:hypothetical protein